MREMLKETLNYVFFSLEPLQEWPNIWIISSKLSMWWNGHESEHQWTNVSDNVM